MKTLLTFFSAILISLAGISSKYFDEDGYPIKPSPERLVNVIPPSQEVLSESEIQALEKRLVEFDDKTSTQIALVVVSTLNGHDISEMAAEIGHRWKVGQKGKDNGIVILLKPKTNESKGQVFIATGYRLEGVIPDAVAKQIVEFEMIPAFKKGNYSGGIVKAIGVLEGLALQEFSANDYVKKRKKSGKSNLLWSLLPIVLFFIFFSALRRKGGRTYSSRNDAAFWTAMFLGSSLGRRGGSSWSDFSSGGGGFGGFGGGGFGGGGAGGSW
jgi:uncharacterized protein